MSTTTKTKRKPAGNGKATTLPITAEPEEKALTKPGQPSVNLELVLIEAVKTKDMTLVERVLAVRRELKAEWAREQYFAALAEFQGECPIIGRTKSVPNDDGTTRYSYTPIEEITRVAGPILRNHGFSWMAKPEQGDASVTIHLEAHHRDGHTETTTVRMPIDPPPKTNKSQATVSATSYATRVAFKSAFGIQTAEEDDDGATSGPEAEKQKPPAAPRKSEAAPRNVTPPAAPPAAEKPGDPMKPEGRKLPPQLAGIKKPGEEAYWLLVDALEAKYVSRAYCETQGVRLSKNRGNVQFLETLKTEIEAAIEKGRKEVA